MSRYMAVINCPSCKKKISDKAKTCKYCNLALQGLDADKMASLSRVSKINKTQRLMTYSFIAMLMFCSGFLFMYWDNVEPGTWQHTAATISTVIGFIFYILIRIMLLFNKRKNN